MKINFKLENEMTFSCMEMTFPWMRILHVCMKEYIAQFPMKTPGAEKSSQEILGATFSLSCMEIQFSCMKRILNCGPFN